MVTKKISMYEANQRLSVLEELEAITKMLVAPVTPESILRAIDLRKMSLANSIDRNELERWKTDQKSSQKDC